MNAEGIFFKIKFRAQKEWLLSLLVLGALCLAPVARAVEFKPNAPGAQDTLSNIALIDLRLFLSSLSSRLFWNTVSGAPELATDWKSETIGIPKHGALLAYTSTYYLTNAQVEKFYKPSQKLARYLGMNGVAVGLGTIVWDVSYRLLDGRPLDEIVKELGSFAYAKNFAFGIVAWAATGSLFDAATDRLAKHPKMGFLKCDHFLKSLARSTFVMGATEGIQRLFGESLRGVGVLSRTDGDVLQKMSAEHYSKIEAALRRTQRHLDRGEMVKARASFSGGDANFQVDKPTVKQEVKAYLKAIRNWQAKNADSAFYSLSDREITRVMNWFAERQQAFHPI